MGRKPRITPSEFVALKRKGQNQSEIARGKDMTRQGVSDMKHRYNVGFSARELVLKEHWPYKVPTEMTYTAPYQRLRDHAEYFATDGEGMSENKLKKLRGFYRKLRRENVVVEFDPSIPPEPGVSNKGGWAYRERLPSDGNLIIRVNDYTNLSSMGEMVWGFPDKEP